VKQVVSIISVVIAVWLAIALLIVVTQRYLVFPRHLLPPMSRLEGLPPELHEITVETADGERLYGLWKPPQAGRPVIVSFHGNASSPRWAAERFTSAPWAAHGWGVLAIAYRGYPGSTGSPSEIGILVDGEAALAYVQNEAPGAAILVHGHSLGTGVAIAMAATHPVLGAYLEAPYASLLSLAKRQFRYLPGFLMRDPMRSDVRIRGVKAPIIAIHGTYDPVIPIASARELMALAGTKARLIEVDGDHVSILGHADAEIEASFRSLLHAASSSPISWNSW
jgi:fermentation-respiration switch protein FrsA (DUF1100 family)